MSKQAWVTLATNDSYALGALVLAHSLRRVGSTASAVVLITPSVTEPMRDRLSAVFAEVLTVDVLDSRDATHLALLQRPELGITFTKLHCWNLTQYDKCVFLDADTLIVQNCDELFEREELSAAPDVGWPDCFNSGVFVFKPSTDTFSKLIKFAEERGSFDGGDQGLLNAYFSDWAHGDINKHLPFLYNVTSAAFYSYIPALKQYGQNLKIIHFIGAAKPWLQRYNWRTNSVEAPDHIQGFLQLWWSLFVAEVHTKLDTAMVNQDEVIPTIPQHEPEHVDSGLKSGHYEAKLDAQSQFPWHHPDNQIQSSTENECSIDMVDFHDPWDIYRGNIPPNSEDTANIENQVKGNYEDVRKYAWEYMPPQYDHHHQDYNPTQIESPFTETQQFQNIPINSNNLDNTREQNEIHYSNDSWRQENTQTNNQQHFQVYPQSDNSKQSDHYHNQHPSPNVNNYETRESEERNGQNENFSNHEQTNSNEPQINLGNWNVQTNYTSNPYTNYLDTTLEQVSYNDHGVINRSPMEYTYSVHLDHQHSFDSNTEQTLNGYISDDQNDMYEEIRPRHPYDGFYLRHRNTIDCRGRKICSHEIPHLPVSPSPPSESPDIFQDALTLSEPTNGIIGENHTGVAGHLARVSEGYQSEAIDELARRQGWEAGNIDYMGADSFDNIWAKISKTLSQAPSPPKQQPPPVASVQPATKPQESPVTSEAVSTAKPEVAPKEAPVVASTIVSAPTAKDIKASPIEEPLPVPVEEAAKEVISTPKVPVREDKTELPSDVPVTALKALKLEETPKSDSASSVKSVADSPPLVSTPATEEVPKAPVTKTEERRKPVGKLQLHPPSAADPLLTPDSELEDAATLAQSIIASEMRTPIITSPSPTTEPPCRPERTQPSCLSVEEPEVPTPPVCGVSLSQIGIKPKADSAIAQSISAQTEAAPQTPTKSTPSMPTKTVAPKKKLVKKVSKDSEESSSGEAPVPPPRKKEKKPKDK